MIENIYNEKLSVIIPVYNAEKYIEECVNSILNQTYENIEIILIDDGSSDNSWEICQKLHQVDSRVMTVHTENQGASNARNVGLEHASGRYLTFVDADDCLCSNSVYEVAVEKLQEPDIDMVVFAWKTLNEKTRETEVISPGIAQKLTAYDVAKIIIQDNILCGGGYPWNKVFKTNKMKEADRFINSFDTRLFAYEDKLFVLKYLSLFENIEIIEDVGYQYRVSDNSLSHNKEKKAEIQKNTILAYELFEEFYVSVNKDLRKVARNHRIRWTIYIANIARKDKNTEMLKWISPYLNKCFPYIIGFSGLDFRLRGVWVYNILWRMFNN